jgi:hypothetical protein
LDIRKAILKVLATGAHDGNALLREVERKYGGVLPLSEWRNAIIELEQKTGEIESTHIKDDDGRTVMVTFKLRGTGKKSKGASHVKVAQTAA